LIVGSLFISEFVVFAIEDSQSDEKIEKKNEPESDNGIDDIEKNDPPENQLLEETTEVIEFTDQTDFIESSDFKQTSFGSDKKSFPKTEEGDDEKEEIEEVEEDNFLNNEKRIEPKQLEKKELFNENDGIKIVKEESANEEIEIVINEIVIGDEQGSKNEFIELYNFSNKTIELEDFSLKKKTKSGSRSNLVSSAKFSGSIDAGKFFVIKNQKYQGELAAELTFSGSSYSIAKDNRIYLADAKGNLVDSIGWGVCEKDCEEEMIFENLVSGQSLSRKKTDKIKKFSADEFEITNNKTPGKENIFSSSMEYPRNVIFSEILANPTGIDKNHEWIELENKNENKVNLTGWMIENDAGKRFKLVDFKINKGELKVAHIIDSSFVIRNSNEILRLIDPAENIVNELTIFGSSPSGISFGWTFERSWSWNRSKTPGKLNIANHLPKIKIKKSKKIYKNIYTQFDASKTVDKDKDRLKFVWDFGDGHKSYLEETKHKYEKKGEYKVILTVKDGFESIQKTFKIKVVSFPRKKLRFTQLLPNPEGSDKGNELIEIENLSSKKVNLFDFYVATGRKSSSLTRHQISKDFVLKPGEKRFLKNDKICHFSLLNSSAKVELLYPDGKSVDKIEYEKEKIEDNDIFQFNGSYWEWLIASKIMSEKDEKLEIKDDTLEIDKEIRDVLNLITHNNKLQICETYLRMQIENWKNAKDNPLVSLRRRILHTQNFSANKTVNTTN